MNESMSDDGSADFGYERVPWREKARRVRGALSRATARARNQNLLNRRRSWIHSSARIVEANLLRLTCSALALKVMRPVLFPIAAELIKVLPGVQTRIVPVVKHKLHRVLTDLFDRADTNGFLAEDQHFLAGTVAFDFGGRGVDSQILERQIEGGA